MRRNTLTKANADLQAARKRGASWSEIRNLERRRDVALEQVDDVIRVIRDGLANNPAPVFIDASRILNAEGADAALQYLENHEPSILADANVLIAQADAAREKLHKSLETLLLKANIHWSNLETEKALSLYLKLSEKAPRWSRVRGATGELLRNMARFTEAVPHLRAAIDHAPNDDSRSWSLHMLANLYNDMGRAVEAEPLYQEVLEIDTRLFGPDHPEVALVLNNQGECLRGQGHLTEAKANHERALAIRKKVLKPDHPDVAQSLNNLANVYCNQGQLDEAQPLYERALAIREKALGPRDPQVAEVLNNLALLLYDQGDYGKAEPIYERVQAIREETLGPMHPMVAFTLDCRATNLAKLGKQLEAKRLLQRALDIYEAFAQEEQREHIYHEGARRNYAELQNILQD